MPLSLTPASKRVKINSSKSKFSKKNPKKKSGYLSKVVDLSDNEWRFVFRYLGTADRIRVGFVGRRWRNLTQTSWKDATTLSYKEIIEMPIESPASIMELCLRNCGTQLQCLDLNWAPYSIFATGYVEMLLHQSTRLQELHLSNSEVSVAGLERTVERLPGLKRLSLRGCSHLHSDGLLRALEKLQFLEALDVSGNPWVTDEIFTRAPPSLTRIIAWGCVHLKVEKINSLGERCPNLKCLYVSSSTNPLTGQSIGNFSWNFPNLKSLKGIHWDDSAQSGLNKLAQLEELRLHGQASSPTDGDICKLRRDCPQIASIDLKTCPALVGEDCLTHFQPWPHLKRIELDQVPITDFGLTQLCATESELQEVHLFNCPNITDKGVGHLVQANPDLRKLVVYCCERVTDGLMPLLETALEHRQDTLPLKIQLVQTAICRRSILALRKNCKYLIDRSHSYSHCF